MNWRLPTWISLGLTTVVGVGAFTWPFVVDHEVASRHGQDLPWLFAVLLGLLGLVLLSEATCEGLEAKTVAVLGVLAAVGGGLRVLSAGTAGLEGFFVLLVLAGRVLGPRLGFLLGAVAMLASAFLTAGVGPWLAFQMIVAGWVAFGAGCLPRISGRGEVALLAGYGLVAGLGYGLVMNLWFWPFLTSETAPTGASFVNGDSVGANLAHYALFYVATSLGWDLMRAAITFLLVLLAGRPVLNVLRRALRRARFDAPGSVGRPGYDARTATSTKGGRTTVAGS